MSIYPLDPEYFLEAEPPVPKTKSQEEELKKIKLTEKKLKENLKETIKNKNSGSSENENESKALQKYLQARELKLSNNIKLALTYPEYISELTRASFNGVEDPLNMEIFEKIQAIEFEVISTSDM